MTDPAFPSWRIVLPGIPITSSRGALGWSTVTLVQTGEYNLLVDTGSYGDRAQLLAALDAAGLSPEYVDALFFTHFHYDHILNFDLFANAVIYLSTEEINYVNTGGYQVSNDPFVPAALYPLLAERVKPFSGEVELLAGLRTIPLPGHTPGMTGLLLENEGVLLAGDGIKNGYEFTKGEPPPVFGNSDAALRSYQRSAEVARVIIPGHDSPFRLRNGSVLEYLDSFSLDIVFSGEPGKEPETIRLPRR
jgi:glyoxylase-like metal-dependent hydrolase (beta-lactamase superfamily II)